MNAVDPFSRSEDIIKILNKQGVFLTVKDRSGILNTMTIGWALFGIIWREPTCMIAVKSSRYTFKLLENADDFTVAIPFTDMKKQLVFCGTHSGSNTDKYKECGLNTTLAKNVVSPIIDLKSSRQYECKIVQMTAMDKNRLDSQYQKTIYQDGAYHTYYFGKIVACYEI